MTSTERLKTQLACVCLLRLCETLCVCNTCEDTVGYVRLQDKIRASTVALRESLVAQQAASKAALAELSVPTSCNRTVAMQYVFVVSSISLLDHPQASVTHKVQVLRFEHASLEVAWCEE